MSRVSPTLDKNRFIYLHNAFTKYIFSLKCSNALGEMMVVRKTANSRPVEPVSL